MSVRIVSFALCALLHTGCAVFERGAGRHTLWEIRDHDNTVYLLGSVHVLPRNAHPFPRQLDDAYNASEEVVFEIDLSTVSPREIARQVERTGKYPPGQTLEKRLSSTSQQLLRDILPAFGWEFDDVKQYRPWFLADAIMTKFLHDRGIRSDHGVDDHYFRRARRDGKRISGLETVAAQADIYTGMTDHEAESFLIGTIASLPDIERTVLHISRSWKNGRTEMLNALLNAQAERDPKISERMFARRNRAWLPRIERHIRGNRDTIFIVGAGHLVGRNGIIESLRQRGYDVKQL